MARLRFDTEARKELTDAARWYAARSPSAGREFRKRVENELQRILRDPSALARYAGEIRFATVELFPFCIFYVIDDVGVLVLAVAHTSREPGYWRARRSNG